MPLSSPIVASHVIQPALLCRNIDATMDRLHALFGCYPSERVDIKDTGVNNAVYAFGGFTFLELIEPYDPASAAMRLLERSGEGFHMVAVDLMDAEPADVDAALEENEFRVVRRNRTSRIKGAWHLHPRDTHGVLMALDIKVDPDDNSAWAGPAWREYIGTNTRLISRVAGISVAVNDLDAARQRYELLGFTFAAVVRDQGDAMVRAVTPRGTELQLRTPAEETSLARKHLDTRPEGLCHLLLEARDLETVASRLQVLGLDFAVARDGTGLLLARAAFGVPFEIVQAHRTE